MDVQYQIKVVHGKPRPHVSEPIISSMAAMLRDGVAIVHTRPRTTTLAKITMRKSTHGFSFHSYRSKGLSSTPELHYEAFLKSDDMVESFPNRKKKPFLPFL